MAGSSPRVRGKRTPPWALPQGRRIIPASAGQTARLGGLAGLDADHPRECGANVLFATPAVIAAGSSPRVRGKLLRECRKNMDRRIIPASAGQTHMGTHSLLLSWDHPRECGANTWSGVTAALPYGSSPRVRGKLRVLADERRDVRIIPASAGQTLLPLAIIDVFADHPRECGANRMMVFVTIAMGGSSPRVRGKRMGLRTRFPRLRIIPASAGQTLAEMGRRGEQSDHPRECGANTLLRFSKSTPAGSSPRVRGKRFQRGRRGHMVRIIPASAGQT